MTEPIINILDLGRTFEGLPSGKPVLAGLSLVVEQGDIIAIRGRSGSGKTTLLNIVGGLDGGFTGRVVVGGNDLATLDDRRLSRFRNETIGFVFQSFNLIEEATCAENVLVPARFDRRGGNKVTGTRLGEVLDRVGLTGQDRRLPSMMSGGQRQRAAIARAILLQPKILLCDEPTGNLDSETGLRILDLFGELNERDGMTVVMVTHEDRVAMRAKKVFELVEGHLV